MVGSQQRDADFLFKLWRSALLRNPPSSAPFLTPMQHIEHEAYLTLLAQKHGVRTPDVEFTARLENGFALLAQKQVPGRTLTDLKNQELTDALLADIWEQVGKLHAARIYHGDLRRANILIDENSKSWLIDFGFAAASAGDQVLGQDTAQLLASMAPVIGAERTVNSALDALGPDELADAAPALQPLALSSATREDLKRDPDFLPELQEALADQAGIEPQAEESVFRIHKRQLLFLLGLGIGVYALLPQLGELNKVIEVWQRAKLPLLALGVVGSALMYVMAAVSQQGAIEKTLDLGRLVIAQFAGTFGSRFGPQGLGGAYIIERYIEKSGLNQRQALTAYTVSIATSAVVHIILIATVFVLLGITGLPLPKDIQPWQIGIGVALVLIVVVFLIRHPDQWKNIIESIRSPLKEMRQILTMPLRAVGLFGGAVGITLTEMATFLLSMWAIGANISPIDAAAVYLVGGLIGSASPTPGGLGVVEGALVAGLVTFGVPKDQAVAGTLIYRFLTYWLPILPALFAFRYLQREKYL